MHRSRGAINLLWQQRMVNAKAPLGASAMHSASSPPPPAAAQESFLSGSNGAYVDEMFESWSRDPTSVHASWDAYFRGINYTPPPSLGNTRANEVPLSAMLPALSGMAAAGSAAVGSSLSPSSHVIEAHLAVQATIRSYQVRGHLAAQIDPLGINNMSMDKAKKMIIRSTHVHESDLETVFQLPNTTWIGGKVWFCFAWQQQEALLYTAPFCLFSGESFALTRDHFKAGKGVLRLHWCRIHAHLQSR